MVQEAKYKRFEDRSKPSNQNRGQKIGMSVPLQGNGPLLDGRIYREVVKSSIRRSEKSNVRGVQNILLFIYYFLLHIL